MRSKFFFVPLFFSFITFLIPTTIVLAVDLNPDDVRLKPSEKKVSVLHNRHFLKTLRPEFGLLYGSIRDEAYLDTSFKGIRAGTFINESVGFEFQYLNTDYSDSSDRKALNKKYFRDLTDEEKIVNVDVQVNPIHSMMDFNAIYAPFYGKLNIIDSSIIYFDLYLNAGISRVETDQGNLMAINIAAGERFYFSKSWSARVDFRDRIYVEQRAGEDYMKHSISVDFGIGYFFL